MNKQFLNIILLCLHFLLLNTLSGQNIPKPLEPIQIVNDFVNLLNPTEKASLEQKLTAYNDSSSTQIAIVIISTTGEYEISQYAFELGKQWGVGQKGLNNGVIILTAIDDKKVFIATGYGVEDVLPDIYAKRIVENTILPAYKEGQYYEGLLRASDIIIDLTKGRYSAEDIPDGEKKIPAWLIILIVLLIIMIISSSNNKNDGSTISSGGTRHTGGWWVPGSGGGSFGGSSGGGGGFGGFGGGSFGGGGAGGSW